MDYWLESVRREEDIGYQEFAKRISSSQGSFAGLTKLQWNRAAQVIVMKDGQHLSFAKEGFVEFSVDLCNS